MKEGAGRGREEVWDNEQKKLLQREEGRGNIRK